jgi:hypothetical protein
MKPNNSFAFTALRSTATRTSKKGDITDFAGRPRFPDAGVVPQPARAADAGTIDPALSRAKGRRRMFDKLATTNDSAKCRERGEQFPVERSTYGQLPNDWRMAVGLYLQGAPFQSSIFVISPGPVVFKKPKSPTGAVGDNGRCRAQPIWRSSTTAAVA